MDNIGNIFAAYRKNLKYSQQDICDKLTGIGVPTKPAAYSTWETGNSIPNAVQFLAMCKILGITDIFNQFIGGYNPDDPMAELNEEGKAMALNYIDLLKAPKSIRQLPSVSCSLSEYSICMICLYPQEPVSFLTMSAMKKSKSDRKFRRRLISECASVETA